MHNTQYNSHKITLKTYFLASAITIVVAIIVGWIANIIFTPIFYKIMGFPLVSETYWAGVWGSTTLNSIKALFNIIPFFPIATINDFIIQPLFLSNHYVDYSQLIQNH